MSFFKHGPKWGKPIACLNAKEYEDLIDDANLTSLKTNGLFDKMVKLVGEYALEKKNAVILEGSSFRITEKNMPYLFQCVRRACDILNISEMPAVYMFEDPTINAFTTGFGHPVLCLSNCLPERLTHDELMFVIGHELGHVKSEHVQYQSMRKFILENSFSGTERIFSMIPVVGPLLGQIVSTGMIYQYIAWLRRSELTADRAGLLTCQNLPAAISVLAKISGYPPKYDRKMDVNDFLEQAQNFKDMDQEVSNKVIRFLATANKDHPWAVQRARELMLWVQDGCYSRVMFRSSPWLEKQIQSAANATKKAIENHDKKQEAVEKMAERSGKRAEKGILKKQEKLVQATEKMEAVQFSEQTLREIYRETTPEEIARHIKKTVDNLKEMRPKKVEKAEEQNVEE